MRDAGRGLSEGPKLMGLLCMETTAVPKCCVGTKAEETLLLQGTRKQHSGRTQMGLKSSLWFLQ